MKKNRIIIICFIAIISLTANAQNEIDALRYSMIFFGGTARYSAMAGAFGAIGADFSTISTNPAGLGVYRKNEFTFTPSIYTEKTSSIYNGNSEEDVKSNFNISNVGIVFAHKPNNNESGWKSINFAFGLNRYDNFNNNTVIEGNNQNSSLMDFYCSKAQGKSLDDLDQFSTQLAYKTGLIDTTSSGNYFSNVPSGGILQRKIIEETGAIQELDFALGANYNNKLYIGGTLGFPYIKFNQIATYKEINEQNPQSSFSDFTLNEDLTTTGTGINFKFGLIYVPIDIDLIKVKVGAAVHSPTYFTMHDDWSSTMESNFNNGNSYSAESPDGSFDYQLTTPMRAIGSLAIQIGHLGTISADYEYVDYSEARLDSKTDHFFDQNDLIKSIYTTSTNLRVGAEVALGLFSLRCGYALYGSPYSSGLNDAKNTAITGGFGIIDKKYFLDFAYVYSKSEENYYLYNYSDMNAANIKNTSGNFLVTLGFKF